MLSTDVDDDTVLGYEVCTCLVFRTDEDNESEIHVFYLVCENYCQSIYLSIDRSIHPSIYLSIYHCIRV